MVFALALMAANGGALSTVTLTDCEVVQPFEAVIVAV
jgi:hypothetical protein